MKGGNTMFDAVIERLASLSYTTTEADTSAIIFLIAKIENHIKNNCNILEIPEGLKQIAVDMVCGYFLFEKKTTAPDSLTSFDLDIAVKQIQEGDTNITFALDKGSTTSEQRLDALIFHLMSYGEKDFVSYRCMQW